MHRAGSTPAQRPDKQPLFTPSSDAPAHHRRPPDQRAATRPDGQGRTAQGDGAVLFRECHGLAAGPCRSADRPHGATAEREAVPGVPELAKGAAVARGA